jgi:hypothetical protein
MGVRSRFLCSLVLAGGLATSAVALAPAAASASATHHGAYVCAGTPKAPGVLTGRHQSNVVVNGACQVNAGRAFVGGDLTLRPGAVLIAAFGLHDRTGNGSSSLTVAGDLRVRAGAAMVLGCDPSSFPCLDDPNQNAPTLSSHDRVFGNLRSWQALGVVVHNVSVGGNVRQRGGGGGVTCNPSGIFAQFGSPVYSTYEDSSVGGNIRVSGVKSCWMGLIRLHVRGNMGVRNNQLADPDAIEINDNHIAGDLACRGNSMVWDSGDLTENLFPRRPQPNTVGGERHGQCVLNSPTSPNDAPGPGPF